LPPKSESHARPTPQVTTNHHNTTLLSLSPPPSRTNTHSPREFGLREGIKSHQITRHIWSGGCTIIHNFRHNTTDGRALRRHPFYYASFQAFTLTTTLALHFFGQIRSEGINGGGTKAIILASEYPICTLLLWFFITRVLLLLAWSTGLRRAPVYERARSEVVGHALELGYMGRVSQVRWYLYLHSLS
jgi:hypothetical protein